MNERPLPGRVEAVMDALRRNNWDRNAAASELQEPPGTIRRLLIHARKDGYTIEPDPKLSEVARKRWESRRQDGICRNDDNSITSLRQEPGNTEDFSETHVGVSQAEIDDVHERFGGRIEIQLARGNFPAARKLIDQAEAEAAGLNDEMEPFGDIPLVSIMELRVANTLEEATDAVWIKDLLNINVAKLTETVKHFGAESLNKLVRAIITTAMKRDTARTLAENQLRQLKGKQ